MTQQHGWAPQNKKAFPVREGSYYLVIQNNQSLSRCGSCFLICFVCFMLIVITGPKIITNSGKSKFISLGLGDSSGWVPRLPLD